MGSGGQVKKRTAAQIKKAVELLKLQRQGIPRHSFFGDDNHHIIDQQVRVLEDALKMDVVDLEDASDNAHDEARVAAFDWVLCKTDDALVEEDDLWVKKAVAAGGKA